MALTVEELQIKLGCDASQAQEVLDKMNATVKAYTDKFQKYFQTKTGDVKPLDDVAKNIDSSAKRIEDAAKRVKKAYKDMSEPGYVPSGRKYADKATGGMGDPNYFKNSEAFKMTFGNMAPNNNLMETATEAWGHLGAAIESVGNISSAVRMKVNGAANDLKQKGMAYVDSIRNYGADSKTTLKAEEAFKKAIISADKYAKQLDKIIAKEQEAAQAKAAAAAQERAAVLARAAALRVEESIRQRQIAATTAAIQADTAPSFTLAPSFGDIFAGLRESAASVFASIKGRASESFSFLKSEAAGLVAEMSSDFKIAGAIMSAPFKALWFTAKGAMTVMQGIGKAAVKVGGAMKKAFQSSLLGRFLKRLGSVMLRMAAMKLIRGTIQGVQKGLEELAKHSASSAKAMNTVKAAGGSIKMALGTAVMPIVKALAPLFVQLAGAISSAANAVARFFAVVTGQSTYTAVTFSSSLDGISSSASGAGKAVKGMLASFDEINLITSQSGGGGGGSTGVESSLSTVSDQLAFSDLASTLREQILGGDWEGVGATLNGQLGILSGKIKTFFDDLSKKGYGTKFAQFLNGVFSDPSAFAAAGSAAASAVNFAITTAGEFLANFDVGGLVDSTVALINTFFEEVDWLGLGADLGLALLDLAEFAFGVLIDLDWAQIFRGIFDIVTGAVAEILSNPQRLVRMLKDLVLGLIDFVGGLVVGGIASILDAMGLDGLANKITKAWDGAMDGINESLDKAIDNINTSWVSVGDTAEEAGEKAKGAFDGAKTSLKNTATNAKTATTNTTALGTAAKTAGTTASKAYTNTATAAGKVGTAIKGIPADRKAIVKTSFTGATVATIKDAGASFDKMKTKTATVTTKVNGYRDLKDAVSKVDQFKSKTISINANVKLGNENDLKNALKRALSTTMRVSVRAGGTSVGTVSLETYASGGIAYGKTAAIIGEYAGASSNPEVVAPLSDLTRILSNTNIGGGNTMTKEQANTMIRLLQRIEQKENIIQPSVGLGQVVDRSLDMYART